MPDDDIEDEEMTYEEELYFFRHAPLELVDAYIREQEAKG